MTSSQNRDAENGLAQRQCRARVQCRTDRDGQRVVVIQRQAAVQGVVAVQPQPQAAESGQGPQPAVVRHDAGLGHAGGARGEDVEGLVLGEDCRGAGRVGGRRGGRQPAQLLERDQPVDLGPAFGDVLDQIGLGHHCDGLEQTEAVGQHLAALVVVEHARDGTALDDREHQQHGVGRVAQHHPDDVTVADAFGGQHRRVAVDRLVGLPIGDALVAELEENPVGVLGGPLLEHLADRGLGRRPSHHSGEYAPGDDRRIHQQTGYLAGEVE